MSALPPGSGVALYRRPACRDSQQPTRSIKLSMALTDSNVLKLAPDPGTPAYRTAPHNIEAEQALLGAILINNDAFYRVSDFLEPKHFYEPIHGDIFQIAGSLIRLNKPATPITLKSFFSEET